MVTYPVNCPQCGKTITNSNLAGGKSALSCSTCKIRFDIKVNAHSTKTGEYNVVNIRKM